MKDMFPKEGQSYEDTDGPKVYTYVQMFGPSSYMTQSERVPGPRTRGQHERWEYEELVRGRERARAEEWERLWNGTEARVKDLYHILQDMIEAAVPDSNGTRDKVVLRYAERICREEYIV